MALGFMDSVTYAMDDWGHPGLPMENMPVPCHPTFGIATDLAPDAHSFLPQGPSAGNDSWVDSRPAAQDISPHPHNLQVNTKARSLQSCRARPLCHLTRTFRPIMKMSL